MHAGSVCALLSWQVDGTIKVRVNAGFVNDFIAVLRPAW
jgi:hypothetical protein